jgi:hypothetical protein
VIASTFDPDGRRVRLTDAAWRHIKEAHPEMAPYLDEITAAVSEPDRHFPGRRRDEEWFFLEGVGPSRWIRAVVHYERGEGWLVTAHAQRRLPRK